MAGRYSKPRCSICLSEHRDAVNVGLINGQAASTLAAAHGFSESALRRHARNCLPKSLAEARERTEVEALTPEQLLAQVTEVQRRAVRLADEAEGAETLGIDCGHCGTKIKVARCPDCGEEHGAWLPDVKSRAAALRELRQTVELLAKLSYAAMDRPAAVDASSRPDLDAAIVAALGADGQGQAQPVPLALGAGDDAEVVEAEIVG